ncbi:hypothetical protein [Agrobacterium vitis]|uniref:hypothetical protein n=1 Tax=Agrobacterium vitis TaxID=373 RepID=UPI0008724078|nr:hypothetical protein [Agrobacterium vitis]MCE6073664.1 hypothetical protein [Agrobacterium vitis]MCM2452224.1 hypothetical protein [Agrobacterium vitis]MCM2469597.1 hypothetical protein [Agrobacterium vitis]MUO68932.1 hypothetical protein [Agrobacterium vitis]MUO84741.1 hypothetical protein [Agrobacterium vitis]
MTWSVGLRRINRLQRIGNRISEILVEGLSCDAVHSKPCGDGGKGRISGVDYRRGKSYVNNPVQLQKLGYEVDELNRHAVVSDLPALGSHRQAVPALNHNPIVGHQKPPVGSGFNFSNVHPSKKRVES